MLYTVTVYIGPPVMEHNVYVIGIFVTMMYTMERLHWTHAFISILEAQEQDAYIDIEKTN